MTKQKKDRESVKKHGSTKIRDNIKLLNIITVIKQTVVFKNMIKMV